MNKVEPEARTSQVFLHDNKIWFQALDVLCMGLPVNLSSSNFYSRYKFLQQLCFFVRGLGMDLSLAKLYILYQTHLFVCQPVRGCEVHLGIAPI